MVITLLTDFGEGGYWVGVMKGVILNITPHVQIVDITHSIPSHQLKVASFILKVSYSFFPPDTVHVVVVDPGVGTDRKALIVRTERYYFVGPDNGVLSWMLEEEGIKKIINIKNEKYFLPELSSTFWGRDVFAPVAAHIADGMPVEEFGEELKLGEIVRVELPRMVMKNRKIIGEVVYVDKFGNLITNIEKRRCEEWLRGRGFSLHIGQRRIHRIVPNYQEAEKGEIVALWGSTGYLEIATKEDSASKILTSREGDKVSLEISSV